jgi:hypothetical protein
VQDVPPADLSLLTSGDGLAIGGRLLGRTRSRGVQCCPAPAASPTSAEPAAAAAPTPAPASPADPAAAEKAQRAAAIYERNIAKLPTAEAALARKQKICPVMEKPLGSMGKPVKVAVAGREVFICCEGCREELLAKTAETLKKIPSAAR